jgi:ketosteroid isomerase-like protein
MRRLQPRDALVLTAVLASASTAALAAANPAPGGAQARAHSATECEVWRREASLARSVERGSRIGIAGHLHPGAVFSGADGEPVRGREAIVEQWTGLMGGEKVELRWRAGTVSIGGNPDVALSRGPFVLRERGPGNRQVLSVGLYQSVWVRDPATREWQVLFGGRGATTKRVADAQEAQNFSNAHAAVDCTTE